MNKILPLLVVGVLVIGGFGAVALDSSIKTFDLQIINQVNSVDVGLVSTHTVLGEFGVYTVATPCKYAHAALKNIYAGGWHPFYYITLVKDKNKNAESRYDELGIVGVPTVVWDGGYRRDLGASNTEETMNKYNTSITKCGNRDVADIDLSLDVEWFLPGNPSPENEGTDEKLIAPTPIDIDLSWTNCKMNIEVTVDNNEASTYNGHLHVYVTEIESSMGWNDTWDNPYTFAFLDYAFNDDISIDAGGTWEDSIHWDGQDHDDGYGVDFSGITQDNTMIVATVFDDGDGYVDETTGFVAGVGNDPKTYDVYFGDSNPPPKVSSNQSTLEYDLDLLDFDTTYYWRIVAWNNQGASVSGPIWKFTTRGNDPPNTPSDPIPEDGEIDVDVDADLNWNGGDPDGDEVTYDVYFGTSSNPPKVESNQPGTSYDPDLLDFDTTYYWKIVAWDIFDYSSVGPIWSFTTEENLPPNTPSTPDPESGDTDVYIDMVLSWTGGDPNSGDVVTYDVYFGKSSPPPLVVDDQSATVYDPGIMDINTMYYWQIVAEDSGGLSSTGLIWSFTTGSDKNKPPGAPLIDGEKGVVPLVEFDYYFTAVDPGGDDVKYYIDWGDGSTNNTDFYESGETVTVGHTYFAKDTFIIRSYAEDIYGLVGPVAYYTPEWKPRNKVQSSQQSIIPVNGETFTLSGQTKTLNLQDTDSLEKIIDDLIARFHDAETQEEKIAILEELVLILDKHGLLPEDVTVEEAKELIVSSYFETLSSDSLQSDRVSDVAGDNPVVVSESISDIEKSTLGNGGGLVDNVEIEWYGTMLLREIFLAILNFPVYYTRVIIKNNNEVPFYHKAYTTLSTRDGRVLDTWVFEPPFQCLPGEIDTILYFTRHDWQRYEYMWGHFNITFDYHILDDGSSVKMLFHGFIFNLGTIIFNPEGEVIDGSGGQNIQSNPTGQQSTTPSSQIDTIGFAEMPSDNNPPDAPQIDGPGEGRPGVEYYWDFMAVDPEEDDVSYEIDWGDGTYEDWIGPYSSGEPVEVGHTYNEYCEVTIRARAKDIYDAVGDWSEFDIEVSKSSQESPMLTTNGKTLYVGGTGEGNYTMIQNALDDACNGDTIFVYNGTYYESIRITKRINLIGQSKDGTIINSPPSYYDCPVYINSNYVKIDGFTLTNKDNTIITTYGIAITSSYNVVSNCNIVHNSYNGIRLCYFANFNTIYGNTIKHSYYGIQTDFSYFNRIAYNNFIDNFNNAYDECSNTWYHKTEGNYWDDYSGSDADGDGIGDLPYNIPPLSDRNIDRFPFMEPIDSNSQSFSHSQSQNNNQQSKQQTINSLKLRFLEQLPDLR